MGFESPGGCSLTIAVGVLKTRTRRWTGRADRRNMMRAFIHPMRRKTMTRLGWKKATAGNYYFFIACDYDGRKDSVIETVATWMTENPAASMVVLVEDGGSLTGSKPIRLDSDDLDIHLFMDRLNGLAAFVANALQVPTSEVVVTKDPESLGDGAVITVGLSGPDDQIHTLAEVADLLGTKRAATEGVTIVDGRFGPSPRVTPGATIEFTKIDEGEAEELGFTVATAFGLSDFTVEIGDHISLHYRED
jgi:hypothetical protein